MTGLLAAACLPVQKESLLNLRAGLVFLGYSPEPGRDGDTSMEEPDLVLKIQRRKEAEQQHDVCLLGAETLKATHQKRPGLGPVPRSQESAHRC